MIRGEGTVNVQTSADTTQNNYIIDTNNFHNEVFKKDDAFVLHNDDAIMEINHNYVSSGNGKLNAPSVDATSQKDIFVMQKINNSTTQKIMTTILLNLKAPQKKLRILPVMSIMTLVKSRGKTIRT